MSSASLTNLPWTCINSNNCYVVEQQGKRQWNYLTCNVCSKKDNGIIWHAKCIPTWFVLMIRKANMYTWTGKKKSNWTVAARNTKWSLNLTFKFDIVWRIVASAFTFAIYYEFLTQACIHYCLKSLSHPLKIWLWCRPY